MLSGDPKYPSRRTYVVKFRSDATLDAMCGRLENLVTCRQSEFASTQELLAMIARDLEEIIDDSSDHHQLKKISEVS